MAAKKSSIALMLSAGLILVTAGGCGIAAETGDMTAYSKEMSYRTDLNVLSDESAVTLTQLASEQSGAAFHTGYTLRIADDEEPVITRSYLTFEEVSQMAAAASVQKSMANADQKNSYVAASAFVQLDEETEVSELPEEEQSADLTEKAAGGTESILQTEEETAKTPFEEFAETKVLTKDEVIASTLNVRSGPGTDYEVVGRFYPGSVGELLEETEGWIKVSSGNVEGWVSSDYLLKGDAVIEAVIANGTCLGTVTVEALNVRNIPSMESDVINSMTEAQECTVLGFEDDGWIHVQVSETSQGYVSGDYLEISFQYNNAMTLEEEQAYLEELARQAEEARQAAAAEEARRQAEAQAYMQAQAAALGTGAVSLSEEDMRLMACVVDMEAQTEPYAGKLAVANVILNRYRSGVWGGIQSIVYSPGQFTGAGTGLLSSYLAAGPTGESMQAVRDACAGSNNIGGLMYFCSAKSATPAAYRVYVWVGSQCFYQR